MTALCESMEMSVEGREWAMSLALLMVSLRVGVECLDEHGQ